MPNAQITSLPDILIIRSLRAIEKGEEVFLTYGSVGGNFEERNSNRNKWLEKCDCELCSYDREASPQAQKRQKLLKQINDLKPSLDDMRDQVKEIEENFPEDYPYLRWELFLAHRQLALRLMESRNDPDDEAEISSLCPEIIQSEMAALEAIGAEVIDKEVTSDPPEEEEEGETLPISTDRVPISTDRVPYEQREAVTMCLEISRCFKLLEIDWRAEQWLRAAIWSKSISNSKRRIITKCHNLVDDKELGGGLAVFKLKYAKIVEEQYPEIQELLKEIKEAEEGGKEQGEEEEEEEEDEGDE
jgi:hypothetical protein